MKKKTETETETGQTKTGSLFLFSVFCSVFCKNRNRNRQKQARKKQNTETENRNSADAYLKHIYKSIYIHRWDTGTQLQWCVTNIARNDLRARGGLGGKRSAPPTRCWGGAKRHPNSLYFISNIKIIMSITIYHVSKL